MPEPQRFNVQAVRLGWDGDEPTFEVKTPLERIAIEVWLARYVETHPSPVTLAAVSYVQQIERERAHPATTPEQHEEYAAAANTAWEALRALVVPR